MRHASRIRRHENKQMGFGKYFNHYSLFVMQIMGFDVQECAFLMRLLVVKEKMSSSGFL